MNEMMPKNEQVRVEASATHSDSKSRWKRALASALGGLSITCVLIGVLTTAESIRVDRLDLYSGGSGGDDMMLIITSLARFGGVVLAFVGLALGSASMVTSRCTGARLLSDFKWGLIGTAGCAVIATYHLRWFIYVIGEMVRH